MATIAPSRTEPLATFAVEPFARDPLPGGGTEPAHARYGLSDREFERAFLIRMSTSVARYFYAYEAMAEGITADELIRRILARIPAPAKPLETHANRAPAAA